MRMEQEKDCIKNAEQSFKKIFSQKRIFSLHLEKWQDDDLYDMYDHNKFCPVLDSKKENKQKDKELEQAIAYGRS